MSEETKEPNKKKEAKPAKKESTLKQLNNQLEKLELEVTSDKFRYERGLEYKRELQAKISKLAAEVAQKRKELLN